MTFITLIELNSFKETSDLLIETNQNLELIVKLRILTEPDSIIVDKHQKVSFLYFTSTVLIENIDLMLDLLSDGNMPDEDNFETQNTQLKDYNDMVESGFSFPPEVESQVIFRFFNYEDFKLSPMQYLVQKRLMISISINYILIDLLRESIKIELNVS